MTNDFDEIEHRLRTALAEAASQVHATADGGPMTTRRRSRRARSRVVVPAVAAALAVAVAVGAVASFVLLRGDGPSRVRTPTTQSKETTPDRLLPLEADADVYMRTDAPTPQVEAVRDFLRQSANVHAFVFIDKATAYEEFKRTFRDQPDLVDSVDSTALPASFRITSRDCAARPQLLEQLAALPGVDEAIHQLGLSHSEAEPFKDGREFPPPNTRGRCGDQSPTALTAAP
jgi:hypothetical protein